MKICFFCGGLNNSGGTERVSTLIGNELSKYKNYEILFLGLSGDGFSFFPLDDNVKYETLFKQRMSYSKNIFKVIKSLRQYLVDNKIDVLINVDSIYEIFSLPACLGLNIRNICWEHFNYKVDLGLKLRKIARHLSALFCDDIVTLTERDKEFWQQGSILRSNIIAINNPSPFSINKAEKINNKVLLTVGRLTEIKGYDYLLDAWSIVIKQRTDWILRVVGDGEDKEKLQQQSTRLNLQNNIEWVSATKQIEDYYKSASLYVLSSRTEGFPMVLVEASSYGLPIVSVDCDTGPAEIVTPECGWLCNPNDPQALAQVLLKAIDECDDAIQYSRLSLNAYDNAQRFTMEKIINKWVNLLEDNK